MLKIRNTCLTVALLCAMCAGSLGVRADDAPADADQPREFTPEEIKAADDLRLTLDTEQQTLFNGLRYLLRPAFEVELMKGRRYQPCPLPPFEEKSEGPLDLLSTLRFWALLQSGMATTASSERMLDRLLATPNPTEKDSDNLAPIAIRILTLRAALAHTELGRGDDIRKKAETLVGVSNDFTAATSDRSRLIQGDYIAPQWFANMMWRSLIMRVAVELEFKLDDKQWEKDLRALVAAHVKDRGWTSYKRVFNGASGDLHTNYASLIALGLANNAPEDTINSTTLRNIGKKLKTVPEILTRLDKDYVNEKWTGSRLMLLSSLPRDYAPERQTPETWRAALVRSGVALLQPSGCIYSRHTLARELGISETGWSRGESGTCETALACIGLSGGLLAEGNGPLAERELASVGRIMYALAVLHAEKARRGGGDFDSRVNYAIEDGAAFLKSTQKPDGSFPGVYSNSPGNSAYCLLAMMHGGVARDDPAIVKGIEWMVGDGAASRGSTYDVAAMLMCMQKYYAPEQREAGILYIENAREFEEARGKVWGSLKKEHAVFIKNLVAFLDEANVGGKRGGWGYMRAPKKGDTNHSDNSCSQYAVLGYKAASLLGAELNTNVFQAEAERLIGQYWEDPQYEPVEYVHNPDDREGDDDERKSRKTRSSYKDKIKPGGWSYMCGTTSGASMQLTAAGISSLTICMDELKVRGKLKEALAMKIGLTIRGAEGWVRRNYYKAEIINGPTSPLAVATSDGWGIFYNLYSVERGCVLAGIRQLEGEVDWYQIGADGLIDNQNMDGSWGTAYAAMPGRSDQQIVNTCLAILFLKRAAMPVITEHKKREKEAEEEAKRKEAAKNPVTKGPEDKKREKEEAEKAEKEKAEKSGE
ncbi:MAG: hypothetical protein KDB90_02410 [Planctomycetes bacterium]|nr:hypothetical protein [Planctomycetota bacterium]